MRSNNETRTNDIPFRRAGPSRQNQNQNQNQRWNFLTCCSSGRERAQPRATNSIANFSGSIKASSVATKKTGVRRMYVPLSWPRHWICSCQSQRQNRNQNHRLRPWICPCSSSPAAGHLSATVQRAGLRVTKERTSDGCLFGVLHRACARARTRRNACTHRAISSGHCSADCVHLEHQRSS